MHQTLVTLASLGRPFAIKGWQLLITYTTYPKDIFEYSSCLLLKNSKELRPCLFAEQEIRESSIIVRLEGVDNREQAARLCHTELVIERIHLPEIDDGYYWHDLQGLEVFHKSQKDDEYYHGKVKSIISAGGKHDILEVVNNSNRKILIPFIHARYITNVDIQGGRIEVFWPPDYT